MAEEDVKKDDAAADQQPVEAEEDSRERSTIGFTYNDLDAAIEVARAGYNSWADKPFDVSDLSAKLNMVISGAFRQKTAAARMFGLIEKDGRSSFRVTELGTRIVQPDTEAAARADAFLQVPLYRAIYDEYKGKLLPPPKALEEVMRHYGVSPKQTDKARQAFERSARQAGYFWAGDNRLARPQVAEPEPPPPSAETAKPKESSSNAPAVSPNDRLAIIRLLVERLPERMDNKKLAQWLRTAEANLRWSFDVEGEIEITERDQKGSA